MKLISPCILIVMIPKQLNDTPTLLVYTKSVGFYLYLLKGDE